MLPNPAPSLLTVTVLPEKVEAFASLLQHGILYPVVQPVALGDFLLSLPGFSQQYLEERVQTIFINGTAADSFHTLLGAGNVVALSAAMPGLAGAIFRRKGLHGSLRTQVIHSQPDITKEQGYIKVKYFNQIAIDRVAELLGAGALIEGKSFHDFAQRRDDLFQSPVKLTFTHAAVDYAAMLQAVEKHTLINLQLHEC